MDATGDATVSYGCRRFWLAAGLHLVVLPVLCMCLLLRMSECSFLMAALQARKPKKLELTKSMMHLRDLTASQLATVLTGLTGFLTQVSLLQLGGDCWQVFRLH